MKALLPAGFIAAGLHIVLFVATLLIVTVCDRSGGTEICALGFVPIELLDFPVLLISGPLFYLSTALPIAICFGVFGTLQWFVLGLLAGVIYRAIRSRPNQAMKRIAAATETSFCVSKTLSSSSASLFAAIRLSFSR
jgi:hypothetical protein